MTIRNITLAIAFVGLNVLDAALTVAAMDRGGVAEVNPIMRGLLGQSRWMFWEFKIGIAVFFALLLLFFSVKYPQQVKRIFIALIVAMVGVCLINTMSM